MQLYLPKTIQQLIGLVVISTILAMATYGVSSIKDTALNAKSMALDNSRDISVLNTKDTEVNRRLEAIEAKLDRLLLR